MDTRTSFAPRRLQGVPSLLLATGWVGLWLLWPSFDRGAPAAVRRASDARVTFMQMDDGGGSLHAKPDLFGRPSRVGFRIPEEVEGVPEVLPAYPARPPHFLSRRAALDAAPARATPGARPGTVVASAVVPRPVWPETAVFAARANGKAELVVEVSPGLRVCGYRFPGIEEAAPQKDRTWQVVLYVDGGEDGRPEHVFVESTNADKETVGKLIRTVYKGTASEPGRRCGGRLTISYGRH